MGNTKTATESEVRSGFGPSALLTGTNGQSYANLYYNKKLTKNAKTGVSEGVGPTYNLTLREADFLTNEESLKGIYYADDVLAPGYTALFRGGGTPKDGNASDQKEEVTVKSKSRTQFMYEIGSYLFYKKRYGARQVSAQIMFNPFLVPGFNCLFLDDSDAGQSFIAKLQSLSHTFSNSGFTTGIDLAYGRDFDEIDFMTGGAGEPQLPEWFDKEIFGKQEPTKELYNQETKFLISQSPDKTGMRPITQDEATFRNTKVTNPIVFPELSKFYTYLLGCDSTTGLGPVVQNKKNIREVLVTTRGVAQYLVYLYRIKETQEARDAFVRQYISRPVTNMEQAMEFLGATISNAVDPTSPNKIPEDFALFTAIMDKNKTGLPGRFDGIKYSDEIVLKLRREVIDKYVTQLRQQRGFRG